MSNHITRYDLMPIPPVEGHTEWFEAGVLRFGVEYRLVNDAISAASEMAAAQGDTRPPPGSIDDSGVSIHVVGLHEGEALEYLRFDCFIEDPHYHYVSWREKSNEMIHIDAVADGDPLDWALERIRTRLPQMLERAGAGSLSSRVDARLLDATLPRLAEAAYRNRYHHAEIGAAKGDSGRKASG